MLRERGTTACPAGVGAPWRDAHTLLAACGVATAVVVTVGALPAVLGRHPRLSDPVLVASTLVLVVVVGSLVRRAELRLARLGEQRRASLEAALVVAESSRAQRDARAEEVEHDARSALGALRASLSTLERYADRLEPDLAHRLQVAALREVDHLEQLIRQQTPGLVEFDVREVVRDVALTRQVAGLRVRTDEVRGRAHGSPGDLATVLGNLLVNAMRHAPGAEVEIATSVVGDRLELRVRDDGPGMRDDLAASAFERGTHGGHHLSTGLGLYISRELMREAGGDLRLEPTTTGCCFVVTLARASVDPGPSLGAAPHDTDRRGTDRRHGPTAVAHGTRHV